MKFSAATLVSIAAIAAAAPTDIKYPAPEGGWENVKYPEGTGADAVPKGGWESIDWTKINYPAGTGAAAPANKPAGTVAPNSAYPFHFTSTYSVIATPDQVVNGTTPTGGLAGASGIFAYGVNSLENTICYNITLHGFKGDYASPAKTATHIHEGAKGASGSPRIVFSNPVGEGDVKRSVGCVTGPFETGLKGTDGKDTGTGFHVSQIEKNPAGFFTDVHSSLAVPGAVRGQLA